MLDRESLGQLIKRPTTLVVRDTEHSNTDRNRKQGEAIRSYGGPPETQSNNQQQHHTESWHKNIAYDPVESSLGIRCLPYLVSSKPLP